jgi:cytochrome P450
MEETTIQGFKVPKNTHVLANFWALDNDHNLYDNPQNFKPERFLSQDEKQFTKPEYLIPFSYGKNFFQH